jgi:hypothetical protein
MLFSERSIWTMVHGIGLGGGALIGLAAALFYLYAARPADGAAAPPGSGALAGATVLSAVLLWLTVIVGTYVIFPPYRVTPPGSRTHRCGVCRWRCWRSRSRWSRSCR